MSTRTPKPMDTIVLIFENRCSDRDLIEQMAIMGLSLDEVAWLKNQRQTGNGLKHLSWNGAAEAQAVCQIIENLERNVSIDLQTVATVIGIMRQYTSPAAAFDAVYTFEIERAYVENIANEYTMQRECAALCAVVEAYMTRHKWDIPVHPNAWDACEFSDYEIADEESEGE